MIPYKDILLFIPILILILFIIREVVTWYWKINKLIANQVKQIELIERQIVLLEEQNKLLRSKE